MSGSAAQLNLTDRLQWIERIQVDDGNGDLAVRSDLQQHHPFDHRRLPSVAYGIGA
jgi:hypothetical protein